MASQTKSPANGNSTVKSLNGRLSPKRVRVLEVLARSAPNGLTRTELAKKTGLTKGWSKLLGSPTKGKAAVGTLEGDGLVRSEKHEDQHGLLVYRITATGKKALAAAK